MGIFDDLFGGFFDLNGDGKTDLEEQFLATRILFDDDEEERSELEEDEDDDEEDF